ncbi:hypothetical protein AM588_10001328 [Phytophthora nicotianae]|uniref:Acetate kinase n=1 Tax=Phytophthora nicotianae TaxID=4792 RepID=A0A0W8CI51_PHYNI|nr:hypothetical protein AM588_10001328 [Phytophthora nicotianae]
MLRSLSSKLPVTRLATRAFSSSVADSHLLVINAGSSSLKYSLFGLEPEGVGAAVFTGLVELSTPSSKNGRITHKTLATGKKEQIELPLDTHRTALETAVGKFFGSDLEALDVFAHRVRKYLGAYALELGGDLDAVIFTAGIGESSAMIRERVCRNLGFLGIELNEDKNAVSMMGSGPVEIQADNAKTKVLVINTDEERSIAEQTYEIALKN